MHCALFQEVKCPKCAGIARRESDTMDTFVCSSWYYFRYADAQNEKEFASKEAIAKWLPVDLYVGGAEHAVLHLLYARFFTKVLNKLGYINFDEPFLKLRNQGLILAEGGQKMSKSLGNVVNPDSIVAQFGADSLRMFEMFMGPLEDAKPWNTQGIVGIKRFLDKMHNFVLSHSKYGKEYMSEWVSKYEKGRRYKIENRESEMGDTDKKIKILLNKTIKKVTEDIENFRFNTAISQMMIFLNSFYKEFEYNYDLGGAQLTVSQEGFLRGYDFKNFLIMLSPFAPHIAEELWEKLGHKESIFLEKWPAYDPELIKDEIMTLVIQVNGKVRGAIEVPADISEEEAKELATQNEKIKSWIAGKEIKKTIFVKGKLINLVM